MGITSSASILLDDCRMSDDLDRAAGEDRVIGFAADVNRSRC